jgi:hypothetical protein
MREYCVTCTVDVVVQANTSNEASEMAIGKLRCIPYGEVTGTEYIDDLGPVDE